MFFNTFIPESIWLFSFCSVKGDYILGLFVLCLFWWAFLFLVGRTYFYKWWGDDFILFFFWIFVFIFWIFCFLHFGIFWGEFILGFLFYFWGFWGSILHFVFVLFWGEFLGVFVNFCLFYVFSF